MQESSPCRLNFVNRLKDVAQKQYSQKEADWAAGKSRELLLPVTLVETGELN
jgi:hypothetical protein